MIPYKYKLHLISSKMVILCNDEMKIKQNEIV